MALNPTLFRALRARFSLVSINNPGKPMLARPLQANAATAQPPQKGSRFGEGYAVLCPFCQSSTPCLTINHRYGEYDASTGFRNYALARCFRKGCLADPANRERLADMALGLVNLARRRLAAREAPAGEQSTVVADSTATSADPGIPDDKGPASG